MTPFFDQDGATLYQGHALSLLRSLPDACVQTCVTSPPYYGLRAYNTEPQVWGGERGCEHEWGDLPHRPVEKRTAEELQRGSTLGPNRDGLRPGNAGFVSKVGWEPDSTGATCTLCNAWRGELGLEPTPALFIEHLTEIFREVKRVLRDDGCAWVNMGDSYASDPKKGGSGTPNGRNNRGEEYARALRGSAASDRYRLRQDLSPSEVAYVLEELGKARRISSETQEERE